MTVSKHQPLTYGQFGSTNSVREAQNRWRIVGNNTLSLILKDEWPRSMNSIELFNEIMRTRHLYYRGEQNDKHLCFTRKVLWIHQIKSHMNIFICIMNCKIVMKALEWRYSVKNGQIRWKLELLNKSQFFRFEIIAKSLRAGWWFGLNLKLFLTKLSAIVKFPSW